MVKVEHNGHTVWCDGVRALNTTLVFLSLFGNHNAVRAVWASLVSLTDKKRRWQGIRIGGTDYESEFRLAEGAQYIRLLTPLSHQVSHLVMLHPQATTQVSPFGKGFFLIGENPSLDYWTRFNRMCRVPIRPSWREPLWTLGQKHDLISPLAGLGPIQGHKVLTSDEWVPVIGEAVRQGILT